MKKHMPKTTVRTVRKKAKRTSSNTRRLSQTIELTDASLFDDISVAKATYLDVQPPASEPFRIALNDDPVLIGRDDTCSISLQLPNVSRTHARVTSSGEEYVLEDLGSTNGTFINNIRITRCVLRNNDRIRIGETNIIYIQQKVRKHE